MIDPMTREETFRAAIKANHRRIYRICDHYFSDPADRDDAYQESLMRIWQNMGNFRGDARLSTWIYRVAVNTCLAYIRSEKSRKAGLEGLIRNSRENEAPAVADDAPDPALKLEFFRAFMVELPSLDRLLVSLYLEEMNTSEMASVTGLSEANVRVRIHRLKEKVRSKWEEKKHGTR